MFVKENQTSINEIKLNEQTLCACVRACLRVRRCQITCSIKSPVDLAVVIDKCHYSFHKNLNMNMGGGGGKKEKKEKKNTKK